MAKHGTRAKYNDGCRCRKCTDEVSAYAWAARKMGTWTRDIELRVPQCFMDDGTPIDTCSIEYVLSEYMRRLKMATLMQEWRVNNREKKEMA